jgi:hypothetical protein
MKLHALVLFLLVTLSAHKSVLAEQSPTFPPDRVVGEVYGKPVTAAEIGLTAPVDTSLEFDARNSEQWQAMGQIARVFGKPVTDRFVEEKNISATQQVIADYKANFRKLRQKHLEESEARLSELKTKLAAPDLSAEEKVKLEKEQKMLDFILPRLRDATTSEAPDELARMFIVARKTEQELHKAFGGRVIFQQAGPEALDARRKLFEQAEEKGDIKFNDPGVRHLFYYYFNNMKHVVVDENVLGQSGWGIEQNSTRANVARPQPSAYSQPAAVARKVAQPPKVEKTWNILESQVEELQLSPTRLVPVESGVWFGGGIGGDESQLGFFDWNEGRVTLLLENGSANWDAVGSEAIAVQLDRKSLVRLDAANRTIVEWDQRPGDCKYFEHVAAFENHFCISSPYESLRIFDCWLKTWQSIELNPVTDADSERLGAGYYKPSLKRFVLSPEGEFWGFQGTLDATRGNAVCHLVPGKSRWAHYGFPWAMARGDEHWPIGISDEKVFFAGQHNILLFDKLTHRWSELKLAWPGNFRFTRFTDQGVLVPAGNTVKRLADDMLGWEDVATLDGEHISGVAAKGDDLYLATTSGLRVFKRSGEKEYAEAKSYPWELADGAKVYEAVLGFPLPNQVLELADKLCTAAEEGDLDLVKSLLSEGANIEATTNSAGSTPLMLACSAGHSSVAKLLLEHGADLHARNKMRQNALTMAAMGKHYELADYLMSKGAER